MFPSVPKPLTHLIRPRLASRRPWLSFASPLREESRSVPRGRRLRRRYRTNKPLGQTSVTTIQVHSLTNNVDQETYLLSINAVNVGHVVQFLPELAVRIFPLLLVFTAQEIFLLTQPIWYVGALFRNEIDLKTGVPEHLEGMKCFRDKQACWMAIMERGCGRCHGDDGTAWVGHFATMEESVMVPLVQRYVSVAALARERDDSRDVVGCKLVIDL